MWSRCMNTKRKWMAVLTIAILCVIVPVVAVAGDDQAKEQERVKESGNVMTEIMNSAEKILLGRGVHRR